MTDYISREAARPDAFCEGISCQECPFCKDHIKGGCKVDDFIKAIPAADVRPVVLGKWKQVGSVFPMYECDQCHAVTLGGNFCPNCGAMMEES